MRSWIAVAVWTDVDFTPLIQPILNGDEGRDVGFLIFSRQLKRGK